MSNDDFPKSIVVVLVVLAVAISILGTFTVLHEMNKINTAKVYAGEQVQSGKIRLRVLDPNEPEGMTQTTGKITFTVENPEVA